MCRIHEEDEAISFGEILEGMMRAMNNSSWDYFAKQAEIARLANCLRHIAQQKQDGAMKKLLAILRDPKIVKQVIYRGKLYR